MVSFRFLQSGQPNPSLIRAFTLATYPYGLSAVVADSRLELQMKSMPVVAMSVGASAVVAATCRAQRGELLNDPF